MDKTKQGGAAGVPPVFISSSFQGFFPGEDLGWPAKLAGFLGGGAATLSERRSRVGFSTLLAGPLPKQHSHAAPASYAG